MMTADFTTASPASPPLDPQQRVKYSLGLVLGVDEFQQEQFHHLERGRQHTRLLHGYGTACGLQLTTSGTQVLVSPGVAVDPHGRVIEVGRAQCADLNQWLAVPDNLRKVLGRLGSPVGPATAYVVLCYRECLTNNVPVPGAPCRSEQDTLAPSRVTESFDLKFSASPPVAAEEAALGQLGTLLRRIEITTASSPGTLLTVAEMERQVRALEPLRSPLRSPLGSLFPVGQTGPLLLHPQDTETVLRAAFRVWITEVRPMLLPTGCGVPADECVLLGQLNFVLVESPTGGGQVDPRALTPIVVQDAERPCLLPTRVLQEWLLGGAGEVGELLGSPLSAQPLIARASFPPRLAPAPMLLEPAPAPDLGEPGAAPAPDPDEAAEAPAPDPAEPPAPLPNIGAVPPPGPVGGALPPLPAAFPTLSGDLAGSPGANTVQRIRNIPVGPTPPRLNDVLMGVADGVGGVRWEPAAPDVVSHPTGAGTYGIVAAGNVPIGTPPPPGTAYAGLSVDIAPGPVDAGRVLLSFPTFATTTQYVVRALPSIEAVAAGSAVVPMVAFAGQSQAPNPPGLVLSVMDARLGTPVTDLFLRTLRLMIEISGFSGVP